MKLNTGIARSARRAAGLAVLLLTVLASCQNPVSGPKAAPSGTVTITLASGAGGAVRSVMPSAPGFLRYVLTLQKGGTTLHPDAGGLAVDGVTVQLEEGEWSVTADAYQELDHDGDGNFNTPAREYKAATATASLTVEAGGNNSAALQLEPIAEDAPDAPLGVFAWNIILPDGVDSASMSLGTVSGLTGLDLTLGANGSAEVAGGVYNLTILLSKDGLSTGSIDKVYIYGGLKTTATLDLSDVIFGAEVLIAGTLTTTKNVGPASVVNAYNSADDADSESNPIGTASIPAITGGVGEFLLGIPASAYNTLEAGTASGKKVYLIAHPSIGITENNVVTVDNLPPSGAIRSFTEEDFKIFVALSAGPAVPSEAADTTAEVTFTGATGLTLGAADFAASSGGTISAVDVNGDTATVRVSFAANLITTAKPYTVSIASDSAVITGGAAVTVTQAASETDLRAELTAGPTVNVAASATTANVTFTGATGLSLSPADFAVSYATISTVSVSGDTATVSVSGFPANTSIMNAIGYYVSIASASEKIRGSGSVTIIQARKIGNGASITSAILLTLNTWASGELTSGGEQWFAFTATTAAQYIHFAPGTLTDVYVQLYNSAGSVLGTSNHLGSSYPYDYYVSKSVTSGSVYFIKITPYSGSGEYKIGFTALVTDPGAMTAMASAPTLSANTWRNDEFTAYTDHFFRFTATVATQYIHFAPGTLTDVYVQLYNSAGSVLGTSNHLGSSYPYDYYVSKSVTSGNVYYIAVWPYSSSSSGEYKIGFNTSTTPPQ